MADQGISVVRIDSWAELERELFADSWRDDIKRFRTRHVFRGLSHSSYRLTTTLQRMGGRYWEVEPFMLRNFRKYAHGDVVEQDTVWHWLSIAQHHGLPTRLLDWTNSPFVALHFATCSVNHFHLDGVVWAVNFIKAYECLPDELRSYLEGPKAFSVEELGEAVKSLEELESLSSRDFMVFFEPPSIDGRIVNQYALFSVMSRSTAVSEDWLNQQEGLCRKIIIPAKLKSDIRDKLDMINATERVFFPGLDGLSNWLKRYYGPSTREDQAEPKVVHRGNHLHFYRHPTGWEYVHRAGDTQGVTIVALAAENNLVLIEQYRVPIGKQVIELPAGLVGDIGVGEGEVIEAAVRRELQEETGYSCDKVTLLRRGTVLPGSSDEVNSLCLAEGLRRTGGGSDKIQCGDGVVKYVEKRGVVEEGEEITVYEIPIHAVKDWLDRESRAGKAVDLKIYAGLFFLDSCQGPGE